MTTVTPMSEAAAVPNVKDQGPRTISKTLLHKTARLKDDTTGWSHKLQELELDLKLQLELKKEQDLEATGNDVDRCLVVLRAAAGRLAPDGQTRITLHKLEITVRDLANRAEVHPNPDIRKATDYFQQKTAELRDLNRSVEETRARLVTQIDQLEKLKIQLEFNRAAVQIGEAVKGGQISLDNIQAIAEDVQRIAADLDRHRRGEL
jgi:hypothetical protein